MSSFKITTWEIIDLSEIPRITDPELCGISDEGDGYLTLRWGGGAYDIDLAEVTRPEDLIWKIHHIGKKSWTGMTPTKISALIEIVAQIKGWPMYRHAPRDGEAPMPRRDVIAERGKMTTAIRYNVIKRDGYRCRCCGASVETGAVLHVDHIRPISKGGETVMANLQTLCTGCNLGKGAA